LEKPKRKLKVNMMELESAFSKPYTFEFSYFLDLETGNVVMTTSEDDRLLENIYEEHIDPETNKLDWAQVLPKLDIADWQKDSLLRAEQVESGYGVRFIKVPDPEPYNGYNEMVDFIYTVSNPRLQRELENAIHGKGAFRRFRNILQNYPNERERWFEFTDGKLRKRIMEWLEYEGIEVIE